jgi:hypothetical protein
MTWADRTIAELKEGRRASCRPHGNSMKGRISSGQLVTLDPIVEEPHLGEAVMCKVKGNQYIHLVKAIKGHGDKRQYLIGNNKGGTNGWIGLQAIFGRVVDVAD